MCSGFLTPAKRGADVKSRLKLGLNRFDLDQRPRVIKAEVKVVQPHCLLLTWISIAGSKTARPRSFGSSNCSKFGHAFRSLFKEFRFSSFSGK